MVWDADGACGLVVVREQDPVVALPYTLPDADMNGSIDTCDDDPSPASCDYGQDPVPNPPQAQDEVADSRRHQFFASCSQRALDDALPNWIDSSDIQAAAAVETCCVPNECAAGMCPLIEPDSLSDEEVLDTHSSWSCCTKAIGGREPITVGQANEGVVWDTSGWAPGVYVVDGYTWEPPYNLWSRRPGFVKIVDSAADAPLHPAAAIMSVDDEVDNDGTVDGCETITIRGCVDADASATLDVWWRASQPGDRVWHRVVADLAPQGDSFEIEWEPHELPEGPILVRVDVNSDHGSYTAHAPAKLEVASTDQCSAPVDPGVALTAESDNVEPESCVEPATGGCGCAATDNTASWSTLVLIVAARRISRRRETSPARRNGHH